VRVINKGHDPARGWLVTSACRRCGTEFEWNTQEGAYRSDQRDGDFYEVGCPVCNAAVTCDAKLARSVPA